MTSARMPLTSRWAFAARAAGWILVTAIPGVAYGQSQQDTIKIETATPAPTSTITMTIDGKVIPMASGKVQLGPGQTVEVQVAGTTGDTVLSPAMQQSVKEMMLQVQKAVSGRVQMVNTGSGQVRILMNDDVKQAPPQIRTDDTPTAGAEIQTDSSAVRDSTGKPSK